jgi:hypothetical protein
MDEFGEAALRRLAASLPRTLRTCLAQSVLESFQTGCHVHAGHEAQGPGLRRAHVETPSITLFELIEHRCLQLDIPEIQLLVSYRAILDALLPGRTSYTTHP